MQRRTLISTLTAVGTIAIAGCSNSSDTASQPEEESEKVNKAKTVVQQYYTAIENNDLEAVNDALHPGVENYPLDEEDLPSYSDTEISWEVRSEITIEEWLDQFPGDTADPESAKQDIDELLLSDLGADEYRIIGITRTIEGQGQSDSSSFAVKQDGEWYVVPNTGSV